MKSRIHTTLELARASLDVIRSDKELLVLPGLSLLSATILILVIGFPALSLSAADVELGTIDPLSTRTRLVIYGLAIVSYVVVSYVTIFFNTALVHAADERLSGGDRPWRAQCAARRNSHGGSFHGP